MVQLSNLALRHLIKELKALENGFVNKVQSLENKWIKMKVHTKEGGKDLVIAPNALFISQYSLPAKQMPGGYSAFLKKYLYNQRIVSLKQKGADRIVVFEFPEKYLVAELFAKGNLVLLDKEWNIMKAMRREEWKDRKLEKGKKYFFPSSKGRAPEDISPEEFVSKLGETKKTFFGACMDVLNISPVALEKAFSTAKAEKKKEASKAGKKEAEDVLGCIKEMYSLSGEEEGKIFLSKNTLYSAEPEETEKTFRGVNEALNEIMVKELGEEKPQKKKAEKSQGGKAQKLEKEIAEMREEAKRQEEKEEELKIKGEAIYLNYEKISSILNAISRGRAKGFSAKELKEKINSKGKLIQELNLGEGKALIKL